MDPILRHHYQNLAENKAVVNPDGSVSTVYTAQIDVDGVPTLIPTVWDGKILSFDDAAKKSGRLWYKMAHRNHTLRVTEVRQKVPRGNEASNARRSA